MILQIKVGLEHSPLPPMKDFKTAASFCFLDSCLHQNPFLAGGSATKVDCVAFERMAGESPSYWKYRFAAIVLHKLSFTFREILRICIARSDAGRLCNGPMVNGPFF